MDQKRRVVVTGLGLISPLGNSAKTSWQNAIEGKSGAALISNFDTENFLTKFAATVKGFEDLDCIDPKEARRTDLFIQYGTAAAIEAINDSGFLDSYELENIGVSVSSGIGGLSTIEENAIILKEKGPRRISPFFVPGSIINMASGNIAIKYGFKGPNLSMVSACSSAGHSIGYSARSISYGDADVMVAGGAEAAISPLGMAGFNAAKALSTRNDSPEEASRP